MMKVWIDQELCTGDAQCVEICPEMFFGYDDGATYRCDVRDALVPPLLEPAVVEAAEYCPGSCIFVEQD
jgi:ferredoxin